MKYRYLFILTIISILSFQQPLYSQTDSVINFLSDSVKLDFVRHSPKKAALYSAMLPGLGQAYNKKYWKIPIVYAGFGGLAFALYYNASRHRCYRNAYRMDVDGDSLTDGSCNDITDPANLLILRDFYRRNLDLAVIGTVLWYALQIVDAVVDAHLFEFRIYDDATLGIDPQLMLYPDLNAYTGLKITINL